MDIFVLNSMKFSTTLPHSLFFNFQARVDKSVGENTSNHNIQNFHVSDEDTNHDLVCSIVWADSSYVNGTTGVFVSGDKFEVGLREVT